MENLHNMPSLGSEAAREIAVTIKGKVSLKSFLDAIAQGGDVKLTANVLLHETVKISKEVNIDLDGHTVRAEGYTPFHFTSGASTITGGTVIGASGVTATAITVSNGATLTINGGTYAIGKDENGEGNTCIYSNGGAINITDGTFSSEGKFKDKYWVLNKKNNSKGTISVTGGKFKGFDPASPNTDDDTSYLAEGYKSTQDGEYYVVTKNEE